MSTIIFLSLYLNRINTENVLSIGYVLASYGVGAIMGGYWLGYIADQYNNYAMLAVSFILLSFFTLLLPLSQTTFYIAIILLFIGALDSGLRPCVNTIISSECRADDRVSAFAIYRSIANVGVAIAALIGGMLAVKNYKYLCVIDAILLFSAAIIIWYALRPPFERKPLASQQYETAFLVKNVFNKYLLGFLLVYAFIASVYQLTRSYFPIYLFHHYNFTDKQYSALYVINAFVVVGFEIPIVNQLKHYNNFMIAGLGALLLCFGLGFLPFFQLKFFAYLCAGVFFFGMIITFSYMWRCYDILIRHAINKGKYFGLFQCVFSTSQVIFPVIYGIIYREHPDWVWYTSIIIGIAGFSLLYGYGTGVKVAAF